MLWPPLQPVIRWALAPKIIIETLRQYHGTQRRFDIIGTTKNNVKVIDDYAHHPTEIRATLKAARNIPHNRLWCLFQPTPTRTLALFDEFVTAFDATDVLIMAEIFAAREKNIYKSAQKTDHRDQKISRQKKPTILTVWKKFRLCIQQRPGSDMVITMGAGDIYKVAEMLMEE